ncbi:methyltransferase [Actinoplanes sp. OR16]|uniref:class I SAM-dependent methyltransferase n=1 Tax=Actinoplanes sp. OR16 TaxID=946334 RepID=UPI000F6BFACF|nr:class I SAM-dependent methyltransferase [Actinoplanes sp. OR16]BBH71071.1 methyltransferase [Actinoplanes sp. OR16]
MTLVDYDREAADYDRTRGGEARAQAAASAVAGLLPLSVRVIADVACGTAIVTTLLRSRPPGGAGPVFVVGVDRAPGMLARAGSRLPGRIVRGDAVALPLRATSVDAVVMVWLLHLLPDAEPVIAEAARVLRPGGVLITTVDKNEAPFAVASDLAGVTLPWRDAHARHRTDARDRLLALGDRHGLTAAGEASFAGVGQGRTPRRWRSGIEAGQMPWAPPSAAGEICRAIAALPDQDLPRPDPVFRLLALTRRPSA